MIRKMRKEDITSVMALWVKGNFKSNYFIEKEYWIDNYNDMKENNIINAEAFIFEENEEIKGFITLKENMIEGIAVKEKYLRNGIGRKLINYCKERREKLILNLYENNIEGSVFLLAMGFKNTKIQIDEKTGEKQYIMEWNV